MHLPLVSSNWQDPGSHFSAFIADTMTLELKSLFYFRDIISKNYPYLSFRWNHPHCQTDRNSSVVKDRQNYGKSTRISCHASGSIDSDTSSEVTVPSSTNKAFLILVLKLGKLHYENLIFWYNQAQTILLSYNFLLVSVFCKNRRGHLNYLRILSIDLWPKVL